MFNSVLLLGALATVLSCTTPAHRYRHGFVSLEIDQTTAHVSLGVKEVKPGDNVIFYQTYCEQFDPDERGLRPLCTLTPLGKGTVTGLLGSHYSTVKTDGSFAIRPGTVVKKVR